MSILEGNTTSFTAIATTTYCITGCLCYRRLCYQNIYLCETLQCCIYRAPCRLLVLWFYLHNNQLYSMRHPPGSVLPQVQVPLNPLYCSERGAEYMRLELISGGPRDLRQLLYHGKVESQQQRKRTRPPELYPSSPAGVDAIQPANGWSHIHIPGNIQTS